MAGTVDIATDGSGIGLGEAVWAFKTTFTVSARDLTEPNIDIVFEGLDTNAVIELVRYSLVANAGPDTERHPEWRKAR